VSVRAPLASADLPVDSVVVLEQEERAGQLERTVRPLGKGCSPQ